MRKSRATVVVAVALTVLSLIVAACGSSDDDSGTKSNANANANASNAPAKDLKGQTVRLWIMNNGPKPVADTEKIVAPFEQKTGIKVKVELVGWDVQLDRIRNAAVSGEAPDVTQAGTTQVPFFAALGGFENVKDRVSQIGGASAYAPGIWKTTRSRARTASGACRGSPRRAPSTTARTRSRRPGSIPRRPSRARPR